MSHGVAVDPLTESFLQLARDPSQACRYYPSLQGYFHDATNRLTLIKTGLYLARQTGGADQEPLWGELDLHYRIVERLVERIQTLFQPAAFELDAADLGDWLEERRPTWDAWFAARGRALDWRPPKDEARGWFDAGRLLKALDAFVNWRSGIGAPDSSGRLAWSSHESHLRIDWVEDEPNCDDPTEGRDSRTTSMALPLLARVVSAHGGTLTIADQHGFAVGLCWPIRAESLGPT